MYSKSLKYQVSSYDYESGASWHAHLAFYLSSDQGHQASEKLDQTSIE